MPRHDPRKARFGPDLYAHATAYWLPPARWPKRHRWAPARTHRRRTGRAVRKTRRFWRRFLSRIALRNETS